jgi:hypothetical protein
MGIMGHRLRPKILDMIGSLQWQMIEEPYIPYQKMAPPLQAEEGGPCNTQCYGSPNLPLIIVISSLVMHYKP